MLSSPVFYTYLSLDLKPKGQNSKHKEDSVGAGQSSNLVKFRGHPTGISLWGIKESGSELSLITWIIWASLLVFEILSCPICLAQNYISVKINIKGILIIGFSSWRNNRLLVVKLPQPKRPTFLF
jgi:hypothetical protein